MGCFFSRRFIEAENGKMRFRIIDGRRFHDISNSEYFVPNDDEEADRLVGFHYAMKDIWGGLFYSPVEEKLRQGARVIDLGCGAGTWILDMAKQYPYSKFVGVDLSPIFPTEGLPSNVEFIEYNVLDRLPYEDSFFDFVHQKIMLAAFTEAQWEENVIPEMTRLTRPDGWVEILEVAGYLVSDGNATNRISEAFRNFYTSRGMNFDIWKEIPHLLENTNAFSEIRKETKAIVLGKKGGIPGQETLRYCTVGLRACRSFLSADMDIMPEHYDSLVEVISIEAEKTTTYYNQYRYCAHKNISN
ncbi:10834_t:CDS:2 [Ambispora gerdemannii]|uniref:10834_t:CDS:1 n=1 Tax=Ambispora gerdemannii TaxID=144530 RepID=A0A9N9C0V5_9GLOM|nr:10834_t:CDS:2 [Ambispora gerdemannii]